MAVDLMTASITESKVSRTKCFQKRQVYLLCGQVQKWDSTGTKMKDFLP
jgi:hypothetical protein